MNKTMQTFKTVSLIAMGALAITSCDNDDDAPVPVNEEEVITTVEVSLNNTNDVSDIITLTSTDPDGDGPLASVETIVGTISAGATYNGSVRFYNDLVSPRDNITLEVAAESLEHEVFYIASGLSNFNLTKTDQDTAGNPLGLNFTLSPGAAGSGIFTVVLRHEPTKPNDGTLAGAGGETDVEVDFDVTVQ